MTIRDTFTRHGQPSTVTIERWHTGPGLVAACRVMLAGSARSDACPDRYQTIYPSLCIVAGAVPGTNGCHRTGRYDTDMTKCIYYGV